MGYSLAQDGFEVVPSILAEAEIKMLQAALGSLKIAPGHRNLMQRVSPVAALAISAKVLDLLRRLTGSNAFPVRSIYFDKTPDANWLVPLHQDLSIAVKERRDIPGYGPWSVKDGVPHVQPPVELLKKMVTMRIHLDDADETNGALQVVPGSHADGKWDSREVTMIRSQRKLHTCSLRSGDALVMRPLLLHASSLAQKPSHRRVIHLEYANSQLPGGMQWAEGDFR